ncbi:hypothetical protein ABFY60_14835 [Lysinibacillus pakistanensis]|uniref:hypothetical protein n=1 Tax=Lysinibacillus pakistanensis TaxID=759811 RepID=UPI003D279DFB
MKWVDLYIDSLSELLEKEKDGLKEIKNLPMQIGFKIGLGLPTEPFRATNVDDLKEHIGKLISQINMREDFVVLSLIAETTRQVERYLAEHGDAISSHLSASENEETKEMALKRIEELTNVNYSFNVRSAIDTWKQIVSVNFSTAQIATMKREILLELIPKR